MDQTVTLAVGSEADKALMTAPLNGAINTEINAAYTRTSKTTAPYSSSARQFSSA